jgi:hypothetical protein
MYAVENGGDGTNINLAAYKTSIGWVVAGSRILGFSSLLNLPAALASAAGFS